MIRLAEVHCASRSIQFVDRVTGGLVHATRTKASCGHWFIFPYEPDVLSISALYHGPQVTLYLCPMCEHFEP